MIDVTSTIRYFPENTDFNSLTGNFYPNNDVKNQKDISRVSMKERV